MVSYDPRGMTWNQYCKLMNELYASQPLSVVQEDKWREWATKFTGITPVIASGVPDHQGFKDWQDWAKSVVGILSIN